MTFSAVTASLARANAVYTTAKDEAAWLKALEWKRWAREPLRGELAGYIRLTKIE